MRFATISETDILHSIINLPQLVFEVTDDCNLNCYYCAYGHLYKGYDTRRSIYQTIQNVTPLLEYLSRIWSESLSEAKRPITYIGFYGGEPLLNMRFIKDIVSYFESLPLRREFKYSMTTNGLLLDRHMEYIAKKKFRLLISLDGNSWANSYRVDKAGNESFPRVFENIKNLREQYPDYFKNYVSFNSVLHNRNNVQSSVEYIFNTFGKKPGLSELAVFDVKKEKKEEFNRIFRDKVEDFKNISESDPILGKIFLDNPSIRNASLYIKYETGNVFSSYRDILTKNRKLPYIPTGTCIPFSVKMFITVNGKILSCEKISHNYSLGYIDADSLNLNLKAIADKQNHYLEQISGQCVSCAMSRGCTQCVYTIENLSGKEGCKCPEYMTDEGHSHFCQNNQDYLKRHPQVFKTLATGSDQI